MAELLETNSIAKDQNAGTSLKQSAICYPNDIHMLFYWAIHSTPVYQALALPYFVVRSCQIDQTFLLAVQRD